MPTLKAIRRRIASVKSTQQITRAMKLVAAARLRRAQEALLSARPYHEALTRVADSLLASEPEATAPQEGAKPRMLIVVAGSDRGLCGGYNANLMRKVEEEARRVRGEGIEPRFFAVGRKAVDHLRHSLGADSIAAQSVHNTPRLATIKLAREIAARLLSDYRKGEINSAALVYSRFHSAVSQRPLFEKLLPAEPPAPADSGAGSAAPRADSGNRGEAGKAPADYLVEPNRAELVPVVMRSYVEAAVYHALLEAEAGFYGAQMTAMDAATNNASDMIERYTLDMNRARQAQITRELMDIVGGAEALRG